MARWGVVLSAVVACTSDKDDPGPGPAPADTATDEVDSSAPPEVDADGDGLSAGAGDCDDGDPTVRPGAPEGCDGRDNDCDGAPAPDELDLDADGWPACAGDCNDADPSVYDGAPELCDDLDNDCDGFLGPDEIGDADGDGFTVCAGDCDDAEATVYPGADDAICDGVDADCGADPDHDVPGDFPTIQQAIDAAADGDHVCVGPGIWVENVDFRGKDLHVLGIDGPEATTLDGSAAGSVVTLSGTGPGAVLEGFTLTGGRAPYYSGGGGVAILSASATLRNLVITGNRSQGAGGGIVLIYAEAELVDVHVSGNVSLESGGGISLVSSSVTVTGGSITGNRTDGPFAEGGGFAGLAATVALHGTRIAGNVALGEGASGGGLACRYCDVALQDLTIAENAATSAGGIALMHASGTLDRLAITGNTSDHTAGILVFASGLATAHLQVADNLGRGVTIDGDPSPAVSHLVVAGNTGGGVEVLSGAPALTQVAVVGNSGGPGVFVEGGAPVLRNAVIAGNVGGDGDAGLLVSTTEPGAPDLAYCDLWGNTPLDVAGWPDPVGVQGNVSVDPAFLDTSAIEAAGWDLHLAATSPLVGAGDPAISDPDGSPSDAGVYGGPGAGGWDRDGDGWFEWWQPGPYDAATFPALGWDCDDDAPAVYPGSGC